MISGRIEAMKNVQWGILTESYKDVGFNLEWLVNKEVSFAFRDERQECITYVRTWGQGSRESEERVQRL